MLTVGSFYTQVLFAEDAELRQLLEDSPIALSGNCQLLIHCKNDTALQLIRAKMAQICRKVAPRGIEEILLICGDRSFSINPELILMWANRLERKIPLITELAATGELAIIRMKDNRGLFITEALATSDHANPNDWTGDDILRYNIPEYFEGYISDLIKHQALTNYRLLCLDGQGNQQEQLINAWLTTWRGDLVRVVEVLQKQYL